MLHYAAFTDAGTGGNPAGVVLDARNLDAAARLAIAAELGYSETAFIEPGADGQLRLRYFSPEAEVDFCGHATIAAAVAIAEVQGPGLIEFETLAGVVPVRTELTESGLTATLTSVPTRTSPVNPEVLDAALQALRWTLDDLDLAYPPHVAFGGVQHLVLAVRTRSTLAALAYDFAAMKALMAKQSWATLQLVWAQSPTVFYSRNPFPPGGVVEDPATGAAAAAFGGYLRALGLVELPARVTILQGVDMGRPSRLLVDIAPHDDRIAVTGAASRLS